MSLRKGMKSPGYPDRITGIATEYPGEDGAVSIAGFYIAEFAVIFSELIARLTTEVRGCFRDTSKILTGLSNVFQPWR